MKNSQDEICCSNLCLNDEENQSYVNSEDNTQADQITKVNLIQLLPNWKE